MNTYNIKDEEFLNSSSYQDFIKENPTEGYLKIRAYAASQAIPISGLNIIISKIIDNNRIIFFEGATNESGIIERIVLPAPRLLESNLDAPNSSEYDISATYSVDNMETNYKVKMYENVYVIQNISVVPEMNQGGL